MPYSYFIIHDEIVYFKNCKDFKGELYAENVKIGDDVSLVQYEDREEIGKFIYYTDRNNALGTLNVYEKGRVIKIADDVYKHRLLPNGKLLYLYDYSIDYYTGELYLYQNQRAEKIDTDVIGIIPQ